MNYPLTQPGLHENVPFETYRTLPGINQSALKNFRRSALHVRTYLDCPPESTEAQSLGTAAHCALLEPARFKQDYFALPKLDRRTREGKSQYELLASMHPGATPLSLEDHTACTQMAESARSSPTLSRMLAAPGMNEVVVLWDDPITKLRCKARMDRLALVDGTVCVLDPKTCRDASPEAFASECARYGYHLQAAFYLMGLDAVSGTTDSSEKTPRRFILIALEKTPPYACATYELCPEALDDGRKLIRRYLFDYKVCLSTNYWPGYSPDPVLLQLPTYAYSTGRSDPDE